MQINEDINNRLAGSTSSNDSGVIMMNDPIHKNYQNNINDNLFIKIIDNNNQLNNNKEDNNIFIDDITKNNNNIKNNNEINIEDLDNVSIRNYNLSNSKRSSTIYSSSNVSINSINQNNNNNINNININNIDNDDDISTVYDSDSDFIEELGDKIDNNNGIVSIRNAIGLNENELENGRVILDQNIIGQNIQNTNNNNNNNNISLPNGISNNGVNINSLSFSGTNNGVTIGPKFICHDLVIKQYVQKSSPKQQFRKFNVDGNSSNDNSSYQYDNNDENCIDNTIRKNQNGLQPNNTEKPKLFSIKSRATLITGSIILLIIILCAITFTALEIQRQLSGSSQDNDHNIGDGDDSRKHIPVNSTIGDELIGGGKVLRIISRDEWIAQPPSNPLADLVLPSTRVIIAHTATEGCTTQAQCTFRVRFIQTFHIESRGWDDIGYNFLVGGDGAVYEGRGWDKQGAHTKGYNVKSIGIAFIGTFNKITPTDGQLDAAKLIIQEGIRLGKLSKDYKLYGHRQLMGTESPGDVLYNIIKDWSHYSTEI